AVLALVGHRDRDGGKIGLEIPGIRTGSEIVFPARHAETLARTARTGRLVGVLLGHFLPSRSRYLLPGRASPSGDGKALAFYRSKARTCRSEQDSEARPPARSLFRHGGSVQPC